MIYRRPHADSSVLARNMIQVNDGTPEFRVRAHIFESLSKNPPAASLFVTEPDWEIGNKGRWSIECAVPPSVLAQLETDLLVERACAGRSEFCTTG